MLFIEIVYMYICKQFQRQTLHQKEKKVLFPNSTLSINRSAGGEWMTAEVEGSHRAYTTKGLRCGTLHHFYLTAHNHIGKWMRFWCLGRVVLLVALCVCV